jgi:hypothetical protein
LVNEPIATPYAIPNRHRFHPRASHQLLCHAHEHFAPSRIFYSVTAVAHFEGSRCVLGFEDPLEKKTVSFNGRTVSLAADFTVPLAVMLQETNPAKHELSRVLNPEKYAAHRGDCDVT